MTGDTNKPGHKLSAARAPKFWLWSADGMNRFMLQSLLTLVFAAVMWVQVPQWQNDWSRCSVDAPDVDCHWYVVAPDNTFGEGFDWANAPWFDAHGLLDVADLNNTMDRINEQALIES